jgi:hypothetical protein
MPSILFMITYSNSRIMEGRYPPCFGRGRRVKREAPSTADLTP